MNASRRFTPTTDAGAEQRLRQPRGWRGKQRSHWGVRKRAVFAAVAVMAAVLVMAGLVLLTVLQSTLISNARDLAVQQLDSVVEQVEADDAEDLAGDVKDTGYETTQILRADGTVLASSEGSDTERLYEGAMLSHGEKFVSNNAGLSSILDFDQNIVVARGVETPDGNVVVVVEAPTSIESDAVSTVGWILIGGVPVLLALAGPLIWFLIGRALQPVERIRETVAGISQQSLDGRVELPNTGDEIDRLARTMNEMLARLEKADESQRRFVTDASHELRSPLASLITGLEVAVADPSGRTWLDSSGMLQTQAQRMGRLIEDLLTLAKIDDSGLRFRMEDVDLDDVLYQEVQRLRTVSRHVIEADLVPVRISGDANRLTQVIRNLSNNAERHAASIVRLSLAVDGGRTFVRVENDGDRIQAKDSKRIFDRFVRLDASRTRESGGSGLGLAISKEIVVAHGGSIDVSENSDGLTCFLVTLPSGLIPDANEKSVSKTGSPPRPRGTALEN